MKENENRKNTNENRKKKNENRELDTLPLFVRIVIHVLSVIFALGILFNTLVLINAHLEKYDYATAFGFSPIAVVPPEDGTPEELFGNPKTERLKTFLSKVL